MDQGRDQRQLRLSRRHQHRRQGAVPRLGLSARLPRHAKRAQRRLEYTTPMSFTQSFVTGGVFHRSPNGLQGGIAWDWLHDERNNGVDLAQVRTELSLVTCGCHECGLMTSFHTERSPFQTGTTGGKPRPRSSQRSRRRTSTCSSIGCTVAAAARAVSSAVSMTTRTASLAPISCYLWCRLLEPAVGIHLSDSGQQRRHARLAARSLERGASIWSGTGRATPANATRTRTGRCLT